MGPYGIGLAYFGPRYEDGIPLEENWITRHGSENFSRLVDYETRYQPGAIRYDVGERSNFILLPMLVAALEQVLAWGVTEIQEYCRALCRDVLAEAREMGYRIEDRAWRSAHLFGVRAPDGLGVEQLRAALAEHRISASVRGSAVRLSPHVYNDERDIDALRAALAGCVRSGTSSVAVP
jgi:selenocysteine lyase/cysteine desulfurase